MADKKILSIQDGLAKNLPDESLAVAGRMLITTDTGEMYYEPEDKKRVKINKVDQTYNPDSENAQSGKAVSEAVAQKADKTEVDKLKDDLIDVRNFNKKTNELFNVVTFTSNKITSTIATENSSWYADTDGTVKTKYDKYTSAVQPIDVADCFSVNIKNLKAGGTCVFLVDENYNLINSIRRDSVALEDIIGIEIPYQCKYILINIRFLAQSASANCYVEFSKYSKPDDYNYLLDDTNFSSAFGQGVSVLKVEEYNDGTKCKFSVVNGKIRKDIFSSGHSCGIVKSVKFGEQYYFDKQNENSSDIIPYGAIFTDDDGNVIKAVPKAETDNRPVAVPKNASMMYVNYSLTDQDKPRAYFYMYSSNSLIGKNVAIIGDSISTNGNDGEDANVVEITISEADVGVELSAYLTYYDVNTNHLVLGGHTFTSNEIGTEVTFTPTADDVGKVIGLGKTYNPNSRKVWWEVAKYYFGFNAIPVCWSGSSISSHEGHDVIYKTSYAWHDAQIRKCGIRKTGSMDRIAPDVIIIYRGCNDMTHSNYSVLTDGYFDNVNFEYPTTDELEGNKFGFKEAYVLLISKLRKAYPKAKIMLCTMTVFKRVNSSHFPTNNGLYTLPQLNNAIREIADYMGCGLIDFDKCGITFENCYNAGYITDSETNPTHPSDLGHAVMGAKAIEDIKGYC